MPPLDLAEFRLLRALKANSGGAPFTQLWNAHAGAAWSVLRALVERDAEAIGWMASFRLDLAANIGRLRIDEGLAPQVGRALYAHVRPSLTDEGPLPETPLTPDEAGVRQLPPSIRLAYLVDLFFDWTPPDPRVRLAYRLLEPAADTDARLVVHAALLQNPPGDALILPPGVPSRRRRLPRRRSAVWVGVVLGAALALAWMVLPPDPVRVHEVAAHVGEGMVVETGAWALCAHLRDAGALPAEGWCPDPARRGLVLVGGRVVSGAAVFVYTGHQADWTLQRRGGAVLNGERQSGGLYVGGHGELAFASWVASDGAWTLVGRAPRARVAALARDLVADREALP